MLLACNREGYGNLCAFITQLRRASVKGSYRLNRSQVDGAALRDCVAILVPPRLARDSQMQVWGEWMLSHFMGRCWLGAALYRRIDDEAWLARLRALGALTAIPLVAVGDVWMHVRSRQPLQDVMTAIRLNKPCLLYTSDAADE